MAKRQTGEPVATDDHIRVLIADDHGLMVEGLRMVLGRGGLDVVGVASNGRQALELTQSLKPDVLLLDIRMPDMDGLSALEAIKASGSQTSVIMLTSFDTPEYMAKAIALGAAGFLSKETDPEAIPQAVRAVAAGEAIVDRELLRAALQIASSPAARPAEFRRTSSGELTEQEVRILKLMAEGMSNMEVAEALSVSRNTVKTHVHNIFAKLGVSDRTQAVILAMRKGMVG
jgi:DNA-binding NarL/FixJ family response regulator